MIARLDHLVLTTSDENACIHFYVNILGMRLETFGAGRRAFCFGAQKINLHVHGAEFDPHAHRPVPGSLDLCFVADCSLDKVSADLGTKNIAIIQGPLVRTGALGPIRSIYLRDPDKNLIEICEYVDP